MKCGVVMQSSCVCPYSYSGTCVCYLLYSLFVMRVCVSTTVNAIISLLLCNELVCGGLIALQLNDVFISTKWTRIMLSAMMY